MKRRTLALTAMAAAVLAGTVGPAAAAWNCPGAGSGAASAAQLQPPASSRVAITSAATHVTWTAPSTGPVPSGYLVTRDGATICTTTKTTCDDANLAPGTRYTYLVTSTAGQYWVSAKPLTVTATTLAGGFALSDVSASPVPAGVELTFTLSATFSFGATDGSYTGPHRMAITSSTPASPGGTVSGGEVTPAFVAGVAKVTTNVYGAGAQTLTVSDGARTGSLAISVTPAPASTLELVSGNGTDVVCAPNGHMTIPAGQQLVARVAVVDAYGNLVAPGGALNLTLSYAGTGTLAPTTLTVSAKAAQSDQSFTLSMPAGSTQAETLTIKADGTALSTRCNVN